VSFCGREARNAGEATSLEKKAPEMRHHVWKKKKDRKEIRRGFWWVGGFVGCLCVLGFISHQKKKSKRKGIRTGQRGGGLMSAGRESLALDLQPKTSRRPEFNAENIPTANACVHAKGAPYLPRRKR